MGCSASSPDAVISNITAMQVQNGMDDINIKTDVTNNVESGSLRTEVSSESVKGAEETVSENESHELERDAEEESGMVIQNISKEATSQVELQDPIQECSGLESAKGIIAKKGYVVYEINLDGELDTCLDNSKRPLPKRLKRLEPLPGAPKLTAEELNEKLERAEQKHLKALAMRKSGMSRRFHKFAKQTPNHRGDAPRKISQTDNVEECESASSGSSVNDVYTSVSPSERRSVLKLVQEDQCKPDENDQTLGSDQQMPNYEVVDLNNSNNNSSERPEKLTSTDMFSKLTYSHHILNVVKEVDEETAE